MCGEYNLKKLREFIFFINSLLAFKEIRKMSKSYAWFFDKYNILLIWEIENKQMWFASYIRGGEAYGRRNIIRYYIFTICCPSGSNYHCVCLNYSDCSNYKQTKLANKKTHL